ncbi:MAG: hypothetical protein C0191_06240 [Mucilaginibacter sp.]|nr:MAG: hypothetical protein C0191_06240 [Mucilaginibacter sp.]HEK19016.1 hypothetical protein [Bacteroidota bacterium]
MKLLHKIFRGSLLVIFLLSGYYGFSQATDKGTLSIAINYFVNNNQAQYLTVKVKTKVNRKFRNVAGIGLKLSLDKDSIGTMIGKVVTNEDGEASAIIPSALQKEWRTSVKHTFLASFEGNKKYEAAKADLSITKAKILIDAGSDKTVTASVFEMKDTTWTPVKGVDIVLAVKRRFGDLPIDEKPTFTTDSTGKASGDFKRDSIPGDVKGNITLVAKIVDNDQYGNLSIEKKVPWGAKFIYASTFNKRTLFATNDKAPLWLILIATSIVAVVWGILIMLGFNLIRIRKLGREA